MTLLYSTIVLYYFQTQNDVELIINISDIVSKQIHNIRTVFHIAK